MLLVAEQLLGGQVVVVLLLLAHVLLAEVLAGVRHL